MTSGARCLSAVSSGAVSLTGVCKTLIRTQTIPVRDLQSHLHSRMRLPTASTAALGRLGLVFWTPAPERLSHTAGRFASLRFRFPGEFSQGTVRGRLETSRTKAKPKRCAAFARLSSRRARGVQSGRRVEGSTGQNFWLIKHTHRNPEGLPHPNITGCFVQAS